MRARYPDAEGFVERDGVKIAYEVFGSGGPWIVLVGPVSYRPVETDGAARAAALLSELI